MASSARPSPTLYQAAGQVLQQAAQRRGHIKTLCFRSGFRNSRQLYALLCSLHKRRHYTGVLRVLTAVSLDRRLVAGRDRQGGQAPTAAAANWRRRETEGQGLIA